ncbi:hypothetical protein GYA49_03135 [Candidatus Beckwithbacteria bacterium]|nr:hypothetical protein [Candidatus Beckwithbacteria bacterium]
MIIYLFGNQDYEPDSLAFTAAKKLKKIFPKIQFVTIKPNEDLPFVSQKQIVIMDVIEGLKQPQLVTQADLEKLQLPPRFTAHDFDLGFQLKYLQKLGKIGQVFIIGLPINQKLNYQKIEKLVAKLLA